jgi:hypothetical protein
MVAEDGRLVVMEKGDHRLPLGVGDGAGAVFFFGVCKKTRRLKVSCSQEKAWKLAVPVMQDLGRWLYLNEQPQAAACLIRYVITRPVVLVFDYQEGVPVLTAWTGRGLTAWFALRRALKAFQKKMPKQFTLSSEPTPEEKEAAAKKAQEKQQKQEQKKEEKRRKQARRAANTAKANANKEDNTK